MNPYDPLRLPPVGPYRRALPSTPCSTPYRTSGHTCGHTL